MNVASKPVPPTETPASVKGRRERHLYLKDREALERRSVWRGLLWLVLLALCFGLWRAGADRAFYWGWWRQW